MIILQADNLSKVYDRKNVAVDNLNLSVEKGQIVGLLGPNGSGKSTIMRILSGLLRPTQGKVLVKGLSLKKNLSKVQAMIGYLPQQDALFSDLTVRENLFYFATIYGVFEGVLARKQIAELAALFHLKDLLNKKVEKLSGGFKRRTAVAATLVHNPEILIFDEPTLGLDPAIRIEFWKLFGSLRKAGKTILISTHYMEEADNCDRVAILRNGKVRAFGSPDDLRRKIFKNIYYRNKSEVKIPFEDVYLNVTK